MMLAQFYVPTIGGEEQLIRALGQELAARGHSVSVVTLWHQGLPAYELDGAVRVYRIKGTAQRARGLFSESKRRHAPPFPDPELLLAIRRIVEIEQPEIVHGHNWLVHSFLPLKAWSGAKLVMSLHDYSKVCVKKNLIRHDQLCDGPGPLKCLECAGSHYGLVKSLPTLVGKWVMSLAERRAIDMYLPVSEATAIGCGLPGSGQPYQVMPNILPGDVEETDDDAEKYLSKLPEGDFMLFVGDLREPKGVSVLLRAYAGLVDAPPLVMIGRIFPDTSRDLPPNVHMLGSWPHHAVMGAWRRSLLGLIPSLWHEPFGLVALEAMMSGRPVIASRIGGLPDIVVDGVTGILTTPGDDGELREAMAALLADPDLRERMGQAAIEQARNFRADKIVPRIERVYEDLLRSRPNEAAAEDGLRTFVIRDGSR